VNAQCVLDPVASWPSTVSGTSSGFWVTEINADAFGADQAHHLLILSSSALGAVEQMGFVKEEHEFGFLGIADGQMLEEFGQHPQQKRRIKQADS
jgi:hypothetical protein